MSKHSILYEGHAPSLMSVVLWGIHVDWNQPWIASASNLIELELAFHAEDVCPSWAQFPTILRGDSSLQRFSLRHSGSRGEPEGWFMTSSPASAPDLNAPIQFPNVTVLTLAGRSQTRAIGFIQKLAFPALKHLALDLDEDSYSEFVCVLAKPVASSRSSTKDQEQPRSLLSRLESLKLAGLPCRRRSVYELYGELYNMASFNISMLFFSKTFLELLWSECIPPGHDSVWLPQLKMLYVSGTSGSALREVISYWKAAGLPLQSLYVEESCELRARDVEWFRKRLKTFEFFKGNDGDLIIDFEDAVGESWNDGILSSID